MCLLLLTFDKDALQGRYPLLPGRVRRRSEGPVRPHDLQVRMRRRALRRRQGTPTTVLRIHEIWYPGTDPDPRIHTSD